MVRILSQNVRGLQDINKRRSVFHHFRTKADIICLQEMHSDENSHLWNNMWGAEAYWSSGSSNAKGVGILIKKNSGVEIIKHFGIRREE